MSDLATELASVLVEVRDRTGEADGWPLRAVPSSGGLHPLVGAVSDEPRLHLGLDTRRTVQKYGAWAQIHVEYDLGCALPAIVGRARDKGLRLSGARSDGCPGLSSHATPRIAFAAVRGAPRHTVSLDLLQRRRSCRHFGPKSMPERELREILALAGDLRADVDRAFPLPIAVSRVATGTPEALVAAANGQEWIADAAAVVVITRHMAGEPARRPDAWTTGVGAGAVHLAATARGWGSCVVGNLNPGLSDGILPAEAAGATLRLAVVIGAPAGEV
jgi:hypothetical protein